MSLLQISQAQGRVPVTIFQLQERIALANFAELEEITKDAYNNGTRDLVLDLSQTPSMTSIGVRAIIAIHKLLSTDKGKHLKLAAPTPAMFDVLQITGITLFIEVFDSVEDAVASF